MLESAGLRTRHLVVACVAAANAVFIFAVVFRIKIPVLFSSPNMFAGSALILLLITAYLSGMGGGRQGVAAKFGVVVTYVLVFLMAWKIFFGDQGPTDSFRNFYPVVLAIIAAGAIKLFAQLAWGEAFPKPLWILVGPGVVLSVYWFVYGTRLGDLKTIAMVVFIAGIPLGLLLAWLLDRD